MTFRTVLLAFSLSGLFLFNLRAAETIETGNRQGIVTVSDQPLPVPDGSQVIPIPGGDFETADGKIPPGWNVAGCQIATDDAPQGKAYLKMEAVNASGMHAPAIPVPGGRPYYFSFWWKSPAMHWSFITFESKARLPSAAVNMVMLPSTDNKWKRVGVYAWMPAQADAIQFHLILRREPEQPGEFECIDDLQLRTASEAEMAGAYEAEKAHLPPYDITPQPGDGSNLALSIAKWEGKKGIPGRPFVVWGIGSSWTEAQRDGYGLIYAIRKAFPNAPPIVYHEHDGAGTPWDYDASWAKGFVSAEQPDLVFTYTPGSLEGLDRLLTEIRKRTTADIIIPSLHFQVQSKMTPEEIATGFVDWAKVQELCEKHHAEFVASRPKIAAYMKANNIQPDDLLWDHTHQNSHLRIRVWDAVAQHITDPKQYTYSPDQEERLVPVDPPAATGTEQVTLTGNWTSVNGSVQTSTTSADLKVHFTGNRIDLIGHKLAGGGTVKVLIDGVPADQAPVFFQDYIKATPKIYPKKNVGGQPGDVAPQAIDLGSNLVPQSWTITMTDDQGNYQIVGSVTGPDGNGNVTQPFTSKSGQISINPIDWRNNVVKPPPNAPPGPVIYGNLTGDRFDFDVWRCAMGSVSFGGDQPGPFSIPLVENLPNQEHTLELVANGDGPVQIDSLYVFQPLEK